MHEEQKEIPTLHSSGTQQTSASVSFSSHTPRAALTAAHVAQGAAANVLLSTCYAPGVQHTSGSHCFQLGTSQTTSLSLTTRHAPVPRTSPTPVRDGTNFLLLNNLTCDLNAVPGLSQLFY